MVLRPHEKRTGKETEKTMTGSILFYGGIAGAVLLAVWLLILLATAGRRRRKMLEKLQNEI